MASLIYNQAKSNFLSGDIDLDTDTVKVMLTDNAGAYVADADDDYVDEAGANDPIDEELSGSGYVAGHGNAGRKTLGTINIAPDDANDRGEFDAADIVWTAINAGTAQAAIIHIEGSTDDTDALLIAYVDTGGFPITTNGGNLTIEWNTEGIIHLT